MFGDGQSMLAAGQLANLPDGRLYRRGSGHNHRARWNSTPKRPKTFEIAAEVVVNEITGF